MTRRAPGNNPQEQRETTDADAQYSEQPPSPKLPRGFLTALVDVLICLKAVVGVGAGEPSSTTDAPLLAAGPFAA